MPDILKYIWYSLCEAQTYFQEWRIIICIRMPGYPSLPLSKDSCLVYVSYVQFINETA